MLSLFGDPNSKDYTILGLLGPPILKIIVFGDLQSAWFLVMSCVHMYMCTRVGISVLC